MTIERRFLPILAAGGALILMHQGLDLLAVTGEADVATPTGRLGLVAVLWTRGPALLAADVCLMLAAVLASWKRALAGLAMLHLLLGAAALAEAPFFVLDAGRMAGSIAGPELTSFRLTVVRLLTALLTVGAGATVVGITLLAPQRVAKVA